MDPKLKKRVLKTARENPQFRRRLILKLAGVPVAGDEIKAILKKWMDVIQKPEQDLIEISHLAERGKFGKHSKKVLEHLDKAIDSLAIARSSMDHAKRHIASVDLEGVESPLSSRELDYLKRIEDRGHNDWMEGWREFEKERKKLERLGLIRINTDRALGMGDVDSIWAKLTPKGVKVLNQFK